jgi:hypothetical protein
MANASAQGSQRDGVDARAAALTAVDNAACLLFFTSRDCPDDSVVSNATGNAKQLQLRKKTNN